MLLSADPYLTVKYRHKLQEFVLPDAVKKEILLSTEKAVIRDVQASLNNLRCDAGTADGRWGSKSQIALETLSRINPVLDGYEKPDRYLLYKLRNTLLQTCQQEVAGTNATSLEEKGKKITHYVVYENGTTLDTRTNLLWQRCTFGETWDGTQCTGKPEEYSWEEAITLTSHFAGYDDWRLPSIVELGSLVDCQSGMGTKDTNNSDYSTGSGCTGNYHIPTINIQVFPMQKQYHFLKRMKHESTESEKMFWEKSWYWSSSPLVRSDTVAWTVYFFNGYYNKSNKKSKGYVRLVRELH